MRLLTGSIAAAIPLLLTVLMTVPASAEIPENACFDLSTGAGVKTLARPLPFGPVMNKDTIASGPNPQGGGWGSARAILNIPIAQTLTILRDQTTLKNPKESDVEVK